MLGENGVWLLLQVRNYCVFFIQFVLVISHTLIFRFDVGTQLFCLALEKVELFSQLVLFRQLVLKIGYFLTVSQYFLFFCWLQSLDLLLKVEINTVVEQFLNQFLQYVIIWRWSVLPVDL